MIIVQNLLVGVAGLSFASAEDFRLGFPLQCDSCGENYDDDNKMIIVQIVIVVKILIMTIR